MLEILDYAKIADVICPVLSVEDVNLDKFKADPHTYGGAFDELGLTTISVLRAQGLGTTIPIIQDIDKINHMNKKKEVRDMYNLFLKSEFEESPKILSLETPNDLLLMMLDLKNAAFLKMESKEERGSFLVEGIEVQSDGNHVDVWGVVRGDGFSSAEHVHLTGYGDLELVGIGSAFSVQALERGRREREERAEEMEIETTKRVDKKKIARRRDDFVAYKAVSGSESFDLKSASYDPLKMANEAMDAPIDVDMQKLIEGFKDMGIGQEAPKDPEAIDDEIEDQEEEDGDVSYEQYEPGTRPIK